MIPAQQFPGMVFDLNGTRIDFSARTHVMGILNITPDSFSDGGKYFDPGTAVQRGVEMVEEGADILDIGGVSTRPGSEPVPLEEELRRVLPVVERLSNRVKIPISIDTFRADVAKQAIQAGACVVNDVTGLTFDKNMVQVVVESSATVVIMHMKGTPRTMQDEPRYEDLVGEIKTFLGRQAEVAMRSGVKQIIVDPGIGFGKTVAHNLELLKRLGEFTTLGHPVLVGPSRKSFIGTLLGLPPEKRVEGTAAAVVIAARHGASLVRVHDVAEIVRALKVSDAISRG